MKNAGLLSFAILAGIANAFEEHDMQLEDIVIDNLSQLTEQMDDVKFISYESHLGLPAMHSEIQDSKWQFSGDSRVMEHNRKA